MNLPLFHLHETPTDTARRELAEHLAACDRCIGGHRLPHGGRPRSEADRGGEWGSAVAANL